MQSLQLQFGATLLNYSQTTTGVAGDGEDDVTSYSRERSQELTIPTLSYALNVATEGGSRFMIEAGPSVVAAAGKPSRFFSGANLLIVPQGEDTDEVERDVGLDLRVTPTAVAPEYADVAVALELSNITGRGGEAGTQVLETDKSLAEVNARVPFGRSLVLGTGYSLSISANAAGVIGLQELPMLGYVFGERDNQAQRTDVLALVSVRRPGLEATHALAIDQGSLSLRLFGAPAAPLAGVARHPYEAPMLPVEEWL